MSVLKISSGLLPAVKKTCSDCNIEITVTQNYIGCSTCDKYFHSECKDVDVLIVNKVLSDGEWFCSTACKKKKQEEKSAFAFIKPLAENSDPSNADIMKAILFMSHKFDDMSKQHRILSDNSKQVFQKFEKTDEKLKFLEDSNSTLRTEVNVLKQDRLETDLVFSGIPVLKEEDPFKMVVAVCRLMNIDVKERLYNAFRLPGTHHPIIATFNNQHLKQQIYDAKRKHGEIIGNDLGFKGDSSGKKIIISFNIISEYYHLLQEARKLRQSGFKFIWYKNHAVHVRKDEKSKIHKILSVDDIKKLQTAVQGT